MAVGGVALEQAGRDGGVVHQQAVQRFAGAQVFGQEHQEVGRLKAVGFAGLGHQVADMDFDGGGCGDGAGDIFHQEVGQDAGIDVAGAEDDGVGAGDGGEDGGMDIGGGIQIDVVNTDVQLVAAEVDFGFAAELGAVVEAGVEGGFGEGNGEDAAAHFQHLGGGGDGAGSAAGDFGHGGEQQIAKAVSVEALAGGETVLKEAAHHIGGFGVAGEGEEAAAEVAGGEMAEFVAQASAAAAAVGHGDDGGEVAVVGAQAGEGGVVAGAAADDDDVFFRHWAVGQTGRAVGGAGNAAVVGQKVRWRWWIRRAKRRRRWGRR